MEENSSSTILDGEITGIKFCLATPKEILTSSISGFPINHVSQLSNSYLGLPLEFGKCSACGTAEPGQCEGHFGYIELPIPIYHPSHINELKRLLSLLCLKCLQLKNKFQIKSGSVAERLLSSCCEYTPQVSIREVKTTDGACYLELKQPSKQSKTNWNFLERYGFRYGDSHTRPLLPCEVMEILKRIPAQTRRKLSGKGFFPQEGYILQYLPVPPNCLSIPDISDGVSVMSSDLSTSVLRKVLKQVEIIKSSRSGTPNFESHEVEANDLQSAVEQYLQVRGTVKASRNIDARYGVNKDASDSSTKAWLEKMRTLFIRKGSGFSSRSVITGDVYKKVNEIGIPSEIAQRITYEERVNIHNMRYLQNLVDNNLCLTYKDGSSTYSLREGSKGHTFLRPGQVVHRRIMDGDIVFINRPPTTHKHSLQALSVYIHDDHTVKINPLICGPLSADFDGDCIHLFYPQSLSAKAEVYELFSVEKQLLSSHSGNLNLQLATDSLLSLRVMLQTSLFRKADAQQLSMFLSSALPQPAFLKGNHVGPCWTAFQILQTAFPACLDCSNDRYLIGKSDILKVDFSKDLMQSVINEVVASIFYEKGPKEALNFFDSLQPLLTENIFVEGFTVSLEDFSVSREVIENIQKDIQAISPLLYQLRSTYNELVKLQIENHIKIAKAPIADFILKSALGNLIDSKSDSAVNKVVQQIGFLGMQLSDKGKFYSKTLVEDVAYQFQFIYPSDAVDYPSAEFGLIKSCFFRGLDPYEGMVHSISTREVMVRSTRGLTEPGTLFKNLMAILRDVVICYDGTVRNVSSNSIIQFQYGLSARTRPQFPAGEPVGVLAATAMSNPAYKAVLDSSPSSNSSWELMKEILLCKVSFKNDPIDRRVILYLNDCDCGRKYCQENAAYLVKNHLRRVKLKDIAVEFIVEYKQQQTVADIEAGLVGHILLNKALLKELSISMQEVHMKCQETFNTFRKKKKTADFFRRTDLFVSECCSIQQSCADKGLDMPCLMFSFRNTSDDNLDSAIQIMADIIYPVLLQAVIKGDPRICSANIIWVNPDTTTWIRIPSKTQKGELALEVVLEKSAVKQNGDAWRTVIDCCLPVLNIIDTQRSIPYAIKQVEQLLGISCAFEQAVQRLSTSVSMVTRGVLREHLMLLANSMTCCGNLIGFNSGGYKALVRSLNIQVPFTEATLFTPRKCFERAAEKCHDDSLSSIVASCSWGKRVAVGTGSRFDLLWNQEFGSDQISGMDVYNFLHMVSGSGGSHSNTDCLGEEVDDLMDIDEVDEWCLSPDHTAGLDKPVFEDAADFENTFDGQPASSSWDKVASSDKVPDVGWDASAWNKNAENGDKFAAAATSPKKQNEWSGWGASKSKSQDVVPPKVDVGWDASSALNKNAEDGDNFAAAASSSKKQNEWSDWGTSKSKSQEQTELSGWGRKKFDIQDALPVEEKTFKSNGWDSGSSWGTMGKESEKLESSDAPQWSGWGTKDSIHMKTLDDSPKSSGWDTVSSWGKKITGNDNQPNQGREKSGWDNKTSQVKPGQSTSGWNNKATEVKVVQLTSGWDEKTTPEKAVQSTSGWVSSAAAGWNRDESPTKGWNKNNSSDQQKSYTMNSSWDHQKSPATNSYWDQQKSPATNSSWDQQKSPATNSSWDQQKSPVTNSSWNQQKSPTVNSSWDQQKSPTAMSSWDQQKSQESLQGWDTLNDLNQPASSSGWDMPNDEDNTESEKQHQWGQTRGSRRWASDASKNRPVKSARPMNDDSGMAAMYTATRQRLDMFTSEEQDILSAVEPLMQSVRKIMHQTGYNDGDPLSAEDQSFVLDNVFAHHPDRAVKMGSGVDYVMVNKHSNFTDTRCFFVVTTDGHKQDFSYLKCLENMIKVKYPDLAEAFNPKYFRKSRFGGNRERSVAPENSQGNRERSIGPKNSQVNRERSVAPENSQGNREQHWNHEQSVAPENSQGNGEQSAAREDTEGGD
ncbi:DNA-directed RNA polymerase V subunit 1 [Hibiscus syriacus]|uniref:DNA-directed RNA polymerase subunit n=1 Tax=Hibiscus syriacus TaxID=106335 RepID=A0A6A3BIB2_HIBSY|nr:DNA-directed RNA polymerase V subunit 1-like [Hibiscus syriacus]KAE8714772.1 DNA-directed RNA polymerase V subunit 1 [Hibiscus syriacus]